ncbi:MAG: hypothetical protein HOV79_29225, partial [Hamadaea sp.]|nr:hypothetical protein [Hamadaea sp.]
MIEDLATPERFLWEAFRNGQTADFGGVDTAAAPDAGSGAWPGDRTLR